MLLSRILTPAEFGTVAVVTVFTNFFVLLSDMGLGAGVIQNKNLTAKDVNSIFSCSVYFSFILMIAFLTLSFPITSLFKDSIYLKICPILSLAVLFSSMNMIPNALMLKEKRFANIAKRTVICNVASSIVTLFLALSGMGVYALCIHIVLSSFLVLMWNEVSTRLIFTINPSIDPIKKIWKYSMFQMASMGVNFLARNCDNLLIGKMFPKADLAYYDKSYSLMKLPILYIPGVINPALHPILSDYQNDKNFIYEKYMKIVSILSTIGVLISILFFTFGYEIIMFLFGSQWENAVLPFKILSISLFGQLLTNTVGSIYQSLGDTKKLFFSVSITTGITLLFICIGVWMGSIITVSSMVSIAYVINYITSFYILIHYVLNKSFRAYLEDVKTDMIVLVVMLLLVSILPQDNYVLSLLCRIALTVPFIIIYLFLTNRFNLIKGFVIRK